MRGDRGLVPSADVAALLEVFFGLLGCMSVLIPHWCGDLFVVGRGGLAYDSQQSVCSEMLLSSLI